MVAKAKNKRFENRVRAIALGPIETKITRRVVGVPVPVGFNDRSWTWVFNPMALIQRAVEDRSDPLQPVSGERAEGEEFWLTGLKVRYNYASSLDVMTRVRISLISTVNHYTVAPGGSFNDGNIIDDEIFVVSDASDPLPTFRQFSVQKVNVLRSKEFTMRPSIPGIGDDHQGQIYWSTSQRKEIQATESPNDAVIDNVGYFKGVNYYWIFETTRPVAAPGFNHQWSSSPQWTSDIDFLVYFKDP